jgi:hypothetical protein
VDAAKSSRNPCSLSYTNMSAFFSGFKKAVCNEPTHPMAKRMRKNNSVRG